MKLGRVLLISALVHGALLLAPIPHPRTPASPDAAPAPALVWMQIAAPAPPGASPPAAASPRAAEAIAVPAAPAAPEAPATRTKIRARAFPDARVRAAHAAPAALAHAEAAAIELPPGDDDGDAGGGGTGPAGPRSGHIPGPAAPGPLLPGPLAGHASVLAPAPAPPFDAHAYGEHVRRRIDAHKHYPPRARRLGLEGVATVIVAVDARGHLARPPRIARSSGVAALDDEALRMARAAAPFPPPAGADARPAPLVVHVPVRFSLAETP
jgi:protein TonB